MDELLIDTQVLADFANLNAEDKNDLSPTNPEYFRNNHTDFVPQEWWTWHHWQAESKDSPGSFNWSWQTAQRFLQEAWREKFSLEKCVELITLVGNDLRTQVDGKAKVYPYQRAVMFLGTNRWRAKFCLRCGNRFVATTPKSIYCTDACFQLARKDSKKAWWSEHGQEWRDSIKKAKSKRSKQ